MDTLLFLYNLLIIIIFTLAVGIYMFLYLKYQKKLYLWISILFISFIADNTVLYMVDTIESFSNLYHNQIMSTPLIKTTISIVTIVATRMILGSFIMKKYTKIEILLFIFYVVGLSIYPLLPFSSLNFFLYFTLSQIITILLYLYFLPQIKQDQANVHLKLLLYCLLIINVATVIEDYIVIFNYDTFLDLNARIQQRNFFEDIGSIIIAVYALFSVKNLLGIQPTDITTKLDFESFPNVPILLHEQQTTIFVKKYALTNRESEVLELLLLDMSNQEIADALFVTVGTLKNHIHNIYQKCQVGRRFQLKCLYDEIELSHKREHLRQ